MSVILQVDFPFEGPWGEEMAAALEGLAQDIASEKGLLWKAWTENADDKRSGGIYHFETANDAQRYLAMHTERLKSFGITNINAHIFNVNSTLSRITRFPE